MRWRRARRRKVASTREPSTLERTLLGALGLVAALGIWQALSSTKAINPLVASSPEDVVRAARVLINSGELGQDVEATFKLFGISFAISLVLGLLMGVILGWYRRISAIFDPWVSIFYAMPRFAFIPLIVVWAGIGLRSEVILVILIAIFPIIIGTAAGVRSIDRDHLRVAQSFLGTNRDVLLTVALPGAVPAVVAGIRNGMILALIGVVVAEFFLGATHGVGALIYRAGLTLQTGQVFVGAVIFAGVALVLNFALSVVERRLDRWRA